ncbi:hypothetical protein SDC9_117516 [bioreactor metagenome]|uniref:Uncharacterized protein n=1 Tax=bioreactor metagenome TaxID=1076179 RepID=A0A645C0V7_9ZZZZ
MLVLTHDDRVALLLRQRHRHDFLGQITSGDGGCGLLLRGQRHAVLRVALDLEIVGHVLGRLGHGIHAVLLLHQLVDEAPADGGVIHRVIAAEGAFGLGHHERRAAHALHATGDHQRGLTGLDGTRGRAHGIQARSAQTVQRGARHIRGQTCQQRRHARHVAVVLARLIGAAVDHVGHGLPVHIGVALHECLDGQRAQVVRAHACQCAAVAAKGSADGVADKGLGRH